MDPRGDPSLLPNGPSMLSPPPPATVRRRLSMDEDLLYQRLMTEAPKRPARPPPYAVDDPKLRHTGGETSQDGRGKNKGVAVSAGKGSGLPDIPEGRDILPTYTSSIELEGIFMRKHEIEDTTKRAEDRRWHANYVTLTGTALNLYKVKKNRTWGRTQKDGPNISPDNPPWMRKAKLEKSYSLLYADAGIAADYKKRRYVIRLRAETDQFLLSCIELSTFNRWLEGLFAAIDVALPIDDRDFPRDMSIPRMQRVRWFRSQAGQAGFAASDTQVTEPEVSIPTTTTISGSMAQQLTSPSLRRRSSSPDALPSLYRQGEPGTARLPTVADEDGEDDSDDDDEHAEPSSQAQATPVFGDDDEDDEGGTNNDEASAPPRLDPAHRLSTTSYPNVGIDPHDGKWVPEHRWTSAHDALYAKLCYSNLLFRSPRKSHYIIKEGKTWYVDWTTGRMVRVLPPTYGEVNNYLGPWQTIHTENMRI